MPTNDNNPFQVRSPRTSRDLIGFKTPPKVKSGLSTEEPLSDMTDFEKLGVYLNFLVVVHTKKKAFKNPKKIFDFQKKF